MSSNRIEELQRRLINTLLYAKTSALPARARAVLTGRIRIALSNSGLLGSEIREIEKRRTPDNVIPLTPAQVKAINSELIVLRNLAPPSH